MENKRKTVSIGIRYHADVYAALEEFARRHFKGNKSAAQNYIDRKALKIPDMAIQKRLL